MPADAPHPAAHGANPHHPQPNETAGAAAVPPAMLGVAVERISDELRYQLPAIKPGAGLIVRRVMPDGPAAQAQVAPMDILLQWNDQLLVHPAQLQVLAQCAKPGDKVTLEYLHRGILTHSQVTLAAKPDAPAKPGAHHPPADPRTAPAARLAELLGGDVVKQAADALADSGIDPQAVAGMLKGAELGKLDPAILLGGKLVLIPPDGRRREIRLGDLMNANGNIGELLKGLDLGKSDPATLLGSKILLIAPDGTETEINLADLLKSGGALDALLKARGQGQ